MRNENQWRPTKFVLHNGIWRGSRDRRHVARSSRLMCDRAAAAYVDALNAHAKGALLDLGCGEVPLYGAYRHLVDSTTCVDWGDSPHLDHEVDLVKEPLPFAQDSFDTILATDLLEHMPYPDRLFSEMARVLRPGGVLIVGVPFYYWIHAQPHDYHRYTEFRLRLFCDDHGLEVEECRPYGGGLDVVADTVGKMLSMTTPTRLISGFPAAVLRRPGVRPSAMPLGYLMVGRAPGMSRP